MITGAVDKKKRKEEVDAFQSDDSDVFLISLKAGGTGLNLTKAQAVIHYDPWWNTAVENQASDRAHRIGQTNDLNIYSLVCANSIDEKVEMIVRRKELLSQGIVDSGNIIRMQEIINMLLY